VSMRCGARGGMFSRELHRIRNHSALFHPPHFEGGCSIFSLSLFNSHEWTVEHLTPILRERRSLLKRDRVQSPSFLRTIVIKPSTLGEIELAHHGSSGFSNIDSRRGRLVPQVLLGKMKSKKVMPYRGQI
jgi:hypothetical protein